MNNKKKRSLIFKAAIAAVLIGTSVTMTACSGWTPFGREYFNETDGKATGSYGNPWLNSVTYGMVKDDTGHNSKDDFYLDKNFEWLKNTQLAEGKKDTGAYAGLSEEVKRNVISLMTDKGTGDDSNAVKNLYSLYLDWEKRNASGFDTVKERIRPIEEITDISALSKYLASDEGIRDATDLISFDFDFDYNDPDHYSFVIVPTRLSLGDAKEYADRTDYGAGMYENYKKQAEYLLKKAGYEDSKIAGIIENGYEFEKEIAVHMKDQEFKFSDEYAKSVNNPRTLEQLSKEEGDFPLDAIIKTYGISDSDHFFLLEPEWLEGIRGLYDEGHLENIKAYLLIKTLQKYAYISDEETFREMKKIYSEINGTAENDDAEYAYQYVKSSLRDPVNRLYGANFSDDETKKDIEALTEEILDAYKKMVSESKIFSAKTKEKATDKLDDLTVNAVFPDEKESGPSINGIAEATTLAEASDALAEYKRQSMISKMNAKSEGSWDFDVTDVNVSYWPAQNCLNIGAGIVGGEYYDNAMSYEEKLGRIGMVICAEMANVISEKGALYDETGKADDWWQEDEKEAVSEIKARLSGRLKTFKPFKDDTSYDGDRVVEKMSVEITGLRAALETSKEYDDFDKEKFFENYANLYREIMTEEYMELTGLNSNTPLPFIRVNEALSENEIFTKVYGLKEGDGMYVSDENRIVIW